MSLEGEEPVYQPVQHLTITCSHIPKATFSLKFHPMKTQPLVIIFRELLLNPHGNVAIITPTTKIHLFIKNSIITISLKISSQTIKI
jgi:hypothetical protein